MNHVLVHGLRVIASAPDHDWRRAGLSNHSPLSWNCPVEG